MTPVRPLASAQLVRNPKLQKILCAQLLMNSKLQGLQYINNPLGFQTISHKNADNYFAVTVSSHPLLLFNPYDDAIWGSNVQE